MVGKTSKALKRSSGSIATVVWLNDRRTLGTRMHGKQFGSADVLAFPLKRLDDCRPCSGRDGFTVPPLGDGPVAMTNVRSHLGRACPAFENVGEGLHCGADYASDGLSGQCPPIIPVTRGGHKRTMRPMGRGTTPTRFREDLATRLKSARVVAGFDTQQKAADALGIRLDRYTKWESGRTPVPAQYVPVVCDLFHVDANYLFAIQTRAIRKIA